VSSSAKYIATSFIWGVIAKVFDAGVKFVSLPLLLIAFGKADFALITLAVSANAYMSLLDLGINTGAVKYFSEWISKNKFSLLHSVARTSLTFYILIGILNGLILLLIATFGISLFSVNSTQVESLRNLFYILAIFSVFNWPASVFNQLLTANESIYYIQVVSIFKSILNLALVFYTIYFKIDISRYFIVFTLLNTLIIIPYYFKAKRQKLIDRIGIGFDWRNFKTILVYSLSILAIGIFQVSATALRPILLSIFSDEGIGIVTDYRVMETITVFIISIGGMFTSIFLPRVSKLVQSESHDVLEKFAYTSTLYTSVICIILCVPFILCSAEIIEIYVGKKYIYLSPWLILWVSIILLFLHSTPLNSMILAKGKTKMLVYITAISCVISLCVNAYFCDSLGAGSAVLGYSIYIIIQMSFYYGFFYRYALNVNSFKVLKSFTKPTSVALLSIGIIYFIDLHSESLILSILLKSTSWLSLFIGGLFLTKIISKHEIYGILFKQS
jgi:O-antigen/teichoic acid export membrane protein